MKAVFSNLLALTLVASHVAPVALAAPVSSSKQEERSLKAVGVAVAGGIASGTAGAVLSNLLNKREPEPEAHDERSLKAVGAAVAGGVASGAAGAILTDLLNKRSLTAIEDFFGSLFGKRDVDARSITAIENFLGGLFDKRDGAELDARSLTAIASFFSNLFGKRDELDERSIDAITNFLDEHFHIARSEDGQLNARSLTAIGNFFKSLFGRSEPSGLMVDTETGIIYMDVPDANEARSLKAIGTVVAGGAVSLATGAAINHFLGRSESGLVVDSETGIIYMDVPDANEGRSLKAIGTAVAGGIASGAASAIVKDIFSKRSEPSGLLVDTETGTLYMDVPDATEARSLKAVGAAVAGGIASGTAGAVLSNLLSRDTSGLLVDTETGTIYADVPDATETRSLKAVGAAVAGGVASGAAGAILSNLLNRDASGLLVDDETGVIYMDVPDANEGRSLKAIGTAVAGGIASGAAGAIIKDILNKRDPEVEERSLKAVGAAVAGGIASGTAGAVLSNLLSRDATSGLLYDTETGTIYMDIPDANEGRSLKAVGTAIAGGIASGTAGAIISDLLNKRSELSGLMVDTETGTIYMDLPDAVEGRSLKAVGTAIAGGIASGTAGAIISDLLNKRAIDELD